MGKRTSSRALIATLTAETVDVGDIGRAKRHAAGDRDVRLALAECYRRRGNASQAGRWGVVFPGWAREDEIDAMRRWLSGQASRRDVVRDALAIADDLPVPAEVADLVEPALRARRPGPRDSGAGAPVVLLVLLILFATICALVCLGSALFRATGRDLGAVEASNMLLAFLVSGAVVGAAALWLTLSMRRHHRYLSAVPVDDDFVVRRAEELLASGAREGYLLLRALVRDHGDVDARRALVAAARRTGDLAEAGRWGCPHPRLTSHAERAAYARALRGIQDREHLTSRLHELSATGWTEGLSDDALDVLRRAGADPVDEGRGAASAFPARWWFTPLLAAAGGAFAAATAALVDEGLAQRFALGSLAATLGGWGILFAVSAWHRHREHEAAVVRLGWSLAFAGGAVGLAVAAAHA